MLRGLNLCCHSSAQDINIAHYDSRRRLTLSKQSEFLSDKQNKVESSFNEEVSESKKPFVEPELSAAVDVLEATTFFQAATSGVTN